MGCGGVEHVRFVRGPGGWVLFQVEYVSEASLLFEARAQLLAVER